MNDVHIGPKGGGLTLTISAIIQIGMLAATILGGWYTLKTNFNSLNSNVIGMRADLDRLQEKVSSIREGRATTVQRLNDHGRRLDRLETLERKMQ